MKEKIDIDPDIVACEETIRGIYGIFICIGSEEYCAYIGRANNMYHRFFTSERSNDGHLVKIKNGRCKNEKINSALSNENAIIRIKILKKVPCQYDNYKKDMQRLAFAEYSYISEYQEKDQCLEQLPDGSNMREDVWLKQKETNNM